jgi:hypothetical protein
MANIVPWNSPNGANLPSHVSEVTELAEYVNNLSKKEVSKIVSAFHSHLYDMATEYTWNRTISILRNRVLSFGHDFVLEMLGRPSIQDSDSDDFLSEVDIINLAADLGFINKTARLKFLHFNEIIKHFASRDVEDEMDKASAQDCIRSCVKYVLGMDDENFDFEYSFANFRKKLTSVQLKVKDTSIEQLISSPYFYKRTIVRALLSLMKSAKGVELENVFSNMSVVIPGIWDDLLPDDRRPIGNAYSQAVSDSNKNEVIALKSVLLKVKGFDYVPETTRSTTFIEAAQALLKTHYGANNFYNEPVAAKHLLSLGTAIPSAALGICMTATLACKLGNSYGISNAAQPILDNILDKISSDRWEYYLNQILPVDETILGKLTSNSDRANRWIELVNGYELQNLKYSNTLIERLVKATTVSRVHTNANDLEKKIR